MTALATHPGRTVAALAATFVLGTAGLLGLLVPYAARLRDPSRSAGSPAWPGEDPEPRRGSGLDPPWLHWTDPPRDADLVLARARARLAGYAWVDPARGVVRVPIERAMEAIEAGADAQALMGDR